MEVDYCAKLHFVEGNVVGCIESLDEQEIEVEMGIYGDPNDYHLLLQVVKRYMRCCIVECSQLLRC